MATSKHAGRLAAEFLVVSVSILAAFAVEEYRDDRARQEREAVALSNIREEIEGNLAAIDAVLPYHEEVSRSIGEHLADPANWQGRASFEVGATVAPRGVLAPDLRTTAWQTAQVTGAVALFDYSVGQQVARVYDAQALGVEATVGRLVDHVFTLSTFRAEETEEVMLLLAALVAELSSQERQLRSMLEELHAALEPS